MRLEYAFTCIALILISTVSVGNCWESFELDLFDLIEEVGQNFYDVFGISQNADQNEVKKTFRKLSLQWHPDRSSDPNAETKFRHIVAINDVLKDEVKRAKYDQILREGMPDWRTPIYYFRRVRKLTTTELAVALSIIISIGHYFVMWAQYFERKLTLEDYMGEIKKKVEKQQKKKKKNERLEQTDAYLQNCYDGLPSPKLTDSLPYRVPVWLFCSILALPKFLKEKLNNNAASSKQADESQSSEDESQVSNKPRNLKNSNTDRLHLELNPKKIEKSDINAPVINYEMKKSDITSNDNSSKKQTKEWTDKDKSELIKAMVKFPAGTANRWNKIGDHLERTAQDCIQMEKQIRSNLNSYSSLNEATYTPKTSTVLNHKGEPEITTKQPEHQAEGTSTNAWSQDQQACLEKALKQIGKDIPNRWDKIAELVPGKSKEECMSRFKDLCNILKKKQQS